MSTERFDCVPLLVGLILVAATGACLSSDFEENLQCTDELGCPPGQTCDPNSFVCLSQSAPIEPLVPEAIISTTEGNCDSDEGAHYPLGTEIFICVRHLPRERTLALGASGGAQSLCEDLTFEHLRAEWVWEEERSVWLSSILVSVVPAGTQVTICWRNAVTELQTSRQLVWIDPEA